MADKTRFQKDLRKLDPDSEEYWKEVLRREGLSMRAGDDTRLSYAGGTNELEVLEKMAVADLTCGDGRKVRPSGAKPE